MVFEFDNQKSKKNLEKHGIDFDQACLLWEDENRLVIEAKSEDEPRWALISKCNGKVWTAFFTYRNNNIRLISVRRARKNEENLYYESEGIR